MDALGSVRLDPLGSRPDRAAAVGQRSEDRAAFADVLGTDARPRLDPVARDYAVFRVVPGHLASASLVAPPRAGASEALTRLACGAGRPDGWAWGHREGAPEGCEPLPGGPRRLAGRALANASATIPA